MAYNATIVPVMIASPGDVADERAVVREIIHEWNDVNSVSSKVMLAPVGWDSHASPELGARPQELINKRVLADCDLLIGVFWTRVGTHTGVAVSGTVEEIQEHVAAGKPAMIYFSSRPVAPDSIDASQYAQLKEFKEWCKQGGLIREFSNIDEFRTLLWKHVSIALIKNDYLKGLVSPPDAAWSQVQHSPSVSEPVAPSHSLTSDGIELLKAAASTDGFIYKMSFLSGRHLQAGSRLFGADNGRDYARWEAALRELLGEKLIVARGYKDEIFELTLQAWNLVDLIEEDRRSRVSRP